MSAKRIRYNPKYPKSDFSQLSTWFDTVQDFVKDCVKKAARSAYGGNWMINYYHWGDLEYRYGSAAVDFAYTVDTQYRINGVVEGNKDNWGLGFVTWAEVAVQPKNATVVGIIVNQFPMDVTVRVKRQDYIIFSDKVRVSQQTLTVDKWNGTYQVIKHNLTDAITVGGQMAITPIPVGVTFTNGKMYAWAGKPFTLPETTAGQLDMSKFVPSPSYIKSPEPVLQEDDPLITLTGLFVTSVRTSNGVDKYVFKRKLGAKTESVEVSAGDVVSGQVILDFMISQKTQYGIDPSSYYKITDITVNDRGKMRRNLVFTLSK